MAGSLKNRMLSEKRNRTRFIVQYCLCKLKHITIPYIFSQIHIYVNKHMNGRLEGHMLNTREWVPMWEGGWDQGWLMKGTKQNKIKTKRTSHGSMMI